LAKKYKKPTTVLLNSKYESKIFLYEFQVFQYLLNEKQQVIKRPNVFFIAE